MVFIASVQVNSEARLTEKSLQGCQGEVWRKLPWRVCERPNLYVSPSIVPTLPKERWQQTPNYAATEKEIQEPNYSGLQDSGSGNHQYG